MPVIPLNTLLFSDPASIVTAAPAVDAIAGAATPPVVHPILAPALAIGSSLLVSALIIWLVYRIVKKSRQKKLPTLKPLRLRRDAARHLHVDIERGRGPTSYETPRDRIKKMSSPSIVFGPSSPVTESIVISICSTHKGIRKDTVEMDITDAYKRDDKLLVPASTKNRPASEEEGPKFLTVPVVEAGRTLRTDPCTNKLTVPQEPPKRRLSSHLIAVSTEGFVTERSGRFLSRSAPPTLETIGEDECEVAQMDVIQSRVPVPALIVTSCELSDSKSLAVPTAEADGSTCTESRTNKSTDDASQGELKGLLSSHPNSIATEGSSNERTGWIGSTAILPSVEIFAEDESEQAMGASDWNNWTSTPSIFLASMGIGNASTPTIDPQRISLASKLKGINAVVKDVRAPRNGSDIHHEMKAPSRVEHIGLEAKVEYIKVNTMDDEQTSSPAATNEITTAATQGSEYATLSEQDHGDWTTRTSYEDSIIGETEHPLSAADDGGISLTMEPPDDRELSKALFIADARSAVVGVIRDDSAQSHGGGGSPGGSRDLRCNLLRTRHAKPGPLNSTTPPRATSTPRRVAPSDTRKRSLDTNPSSIVRSPLAGSPSSGSSRFLTVPVATYGKAARRRSIVGVSGRSAINGALHMQTQVTGSSLATAAKESASKRPEGSMVVAQVSQPTTDVKHESKVASMDSDQSWASAPSLIDDFDSATTIDTTLNTTFNSSASASAASVGREACVIADTSGVENTVLGAEDLQALRDGGDNRFDTDSPQLMDQVDLKAKFKCIELDKSPTNYSATTAISAKHDPVEYDQSDFIGRFKIGTVFDDLSLEEIAPLLAADICKGVLPQPGPSAYMEFGKMRFGAHARPTAADFLRDARVILFDAIRSSGGLEVVQRAAKRAADLRLKPRLPSSPVLARAMSTCSKRAPHLSATLPRTRTGPQPYAPLDSSPLASGLVIIGPPKIEIEVEVTPDPAPTPARVSKLFIKRVLSTISKSSNIPTGPEYAVSEGRRQPLKDTQPRSATESSLVLRTARLSSCSLARSVSNVKTSLPLPTMAKTRTPAGTASLSSGICRPAIQVRPPSGNPGCALITRTAKSVHRLSTVLSRRDTLSSLSDVSRGLSRYPAFSRHGNALPSSPGRAVPTMASASQPRMATSYVARQDRAHTGYSSTLRAPTSCSLLRTRVAMDGPRPGSGGLSASPRAKWR